MSDRRPWDDVYSDGAEDTMSDTRDLAVSFVSLAGLSGLVCRSGRMACLLDDVKCGEEDELGFVVFAHSFDMRFELLHDVFPVLKRGISSTVGRGKWGVSPLRYPTRGTRGRRGCRLLCVPSRREHLDS